MQYTLHNVVKHQFIYITFITAYERIASLSILFEATYFNQSTYPLNVGHQPSESVTSKLFTNTMKKHFPFFFYVTYTEYFNGVFDRLYVLITF